MGNKVFVIITQLFHCNTATTMNNMKMNKDGCVPIKLYFFTIAFQIQKKVLLYALYKNRWRARFGFGVTAC